jgi:large subunit ribosomal protein L3
MINGIIGKKVGMTQIFAADGAVTPVTVIKAGPCVVVQKKSAGGKDGYDAVQIGLVEDRPIKLKNVTKPMRGHFEKTGGGIPPTRVLKEFRLDAADDSTNIGDKILVDQFADGDLVDVIGKSKGRGLCRHSEASQLQSRSRDARFDERARAGFDWRFGVSVPGRQRHALFGSHG